MSISIEDLDYLNDPARTTDEIFTFVKRGLPWVDRVYIAKHVIAMKANACGSPQVGFYKQITEAQARAIVERERQALLDVVDSEGGHACRQHARRSATGSAPSPAFCRRGTWRIQTH